MSKIKVFEGDLPQDLDLSNEKFIGLDILPLFKSNTDSIISSGKSFLVFQPKSMSSSVRSAIFFAIEEKF